HVSSPVTQSPATRSRARRKGRVCANKPYVRLARNTRTARAGGEGEAAGARGPGRLLVRRRRDRAAPRRGGGLPARAQGPSRPPVARPGRSGRAIGGAGCPV